MSEQQSGKGPIKTHRDSNVFVKIWRNERENAPPSYNVTLGRTYTDAQSGELRESQSFSGAEILKVQAQLGEAYRTIGQERALDREYARAPDRGLEAQRDAALSRTSTPERGTGDRSRSRTRQPDQ